MLVVLKFLWYYDVVNETKEFVLLLLYFHLKGGQYIEINQKNRGRFNKPNAYNAKGENKLEEKILRSKERVYEEDGATISIVREFEGCGSSILEQTISFLIDKMNKTEKEKAKKDIDTEMQL